MNIQVVPDRLWATARTMQRASVRLGELRGGLAVAIAAVEPALGGREATAGMQELWRRWSVGLAALASASAAQGQALADAAGAYIAADTAPAAAVADTGSVPASTTRGRR